MAQLGMLLKSGTNIDIIIYPLAVLSVVYLLALGIVFWIQNHPDKMQRIITASGIPKLKEWLLEKWHHFRDARNVTWHL